ncbi:K(+)-transporting ATPase subunit F [Serratia ureilytica]|nr:K(+)-transporting ATPase subunit F [Serratia ureilytica]
MSFSVIGGALLVLLLLAYLVYALFNAEAFEVTDGAIVHLQRDIDNQSAFRVTQRINPA